MKIFKYLFLSFLSIIIWGFWWTIALIVISLLIIITFIAPKKNIDHLVKIGCQILTYSLFIFPKHKGIQPKDVPYPVIFVGNHVSFFDLFISGTVLPGYPRGLELKSHFETPIYGWFITRFGEIPIDPTSKTGIKESILKAESILKNKIRNLFVMPEGTRTRDGKIGKFKSGAFYISRKTNFPIVPVVYKRLFDRNNRHNFFIIPGTFDVIIMDPVYPDKFTSEDEMGEYVRTIMQKKLDEN